MGMNHAQRHVISLITLQHKVAGKILAAPTVVVKKDIHSQGHVRGSQSSSYDSNVSNVAEVGLTNIC